MHFHKKLTRLLSNDKKQAGVIKFWLERELHRTNWYWIGILNLKFKFETLEAERVQMEAKIAFAWSIWCAPCFDPLSLSNSSIVVSATVILESSVFALSLSLSRVIDQFICFWTPSFTSYRPSSSSSRASRL